MCVPLDSWVGFRVVAGFGWLRGLLNFVKNNSFRVGWLMTPRLGNLWTSFKAWTPMRRWLPWMLFAAASSWYVCMWDCHWCVQGSKRLSQTVGTLKDHGNAAVLLANMSKMAGCGTKKARTRRTVDHRAEVLAVSTLAGRFCGWMGWQGKEWEGSSLMLCNAGWLDDGDYGVAAEIAFSVGYNRLCGFGCSYCGCRRCLAWGVKETGVVREDVRLIFSWGTRVAAAKIATTQEHLDLDDEVNNASEVQEEWGLELPEYVGGEGTSRQAFFFVWRWRGTL